MFFEAIFDFYTLDMLYTFIIDSSMLKPFRQSYLKGHLAMCK